MKTILFIVMLFFQFSYSQTAIVPSYYQIDEKLSKDLYKIVLDLELGHNFDVGEDGIE